jgi:hypothetical protein
MSSGYGYWVVTPYVVQPFEGTCFIFHLIRSKSSLFLLLRWDLPNYTALPFMTSVVINTGTLFLSLSSHRYFIEPVLDKGRQCSFRRCKFNVMVLIVVLFAPREKKMFAVLFLGL